MKKMFYMIENHPADSRVQIDDSGTCQTLSARMGTGGGNVPMVMFIARKYAEYEEGLPTLRASGGDAGGGRKDLSCWAIDSHTMDSRIAIVGDICPTIAAHIAKVGADGPLVLLRKNDE